jgi:hypothetical protein
VFHVDSAQRHRWPWTVRDVQHPILRVTDHFSDVRESNEAVKSLRKYLRPCPQFLLPSMIRIFFLLTAGHVQTEFDICVSL